MVFIIDSRADAAHERLLMMKMKKYHIAVLVLSGLGALFFLWAVVATVLNFTKPEQEKITLNERAQSMRYAKSAVVSDSAFCAEIGRNIMLNGGNAVDAAIASSFCTGVTVPYATGIGGGAFTIIYIKESKKCIFLNSRETAPIKSHRNMFRVDKEMAQFGYQSIGVPGMIHGLWTAYKLYGSKMVTWKELVTPSVKLARANPNSLAIKNYMFRIKQYEDRKDIEPLKRLYIDPLTGDYYNEGDILHNEALAETLETIANSDDPIKLFYNGTMTEGMIDEIRDHDGIITKEDFERYETDITDALYSSIGNYVMCGPPPPSSWVITQSIARIIDKLYENRQVYQDAEFYHHLIEAEKLAYGLRGNLGDARFNHYSHELARNLTNSDIIDLLVSRISQRSEEVEYYLMPEPGTMDHGTSHTSVVDNNGNAVSITSTLNMAFGSKMLSKYGFAYNNEMDDFSTPGLVNHWGFQPSEANMIRPGRRPLSSMSPTVVFNPLDGRVKMVTGATGGSKIISATAQTILRAIVLNESADQIVNYPRVHNQLTPFETMVEKGFNEKIQNDLARKYNQIMKIVDYPLAIVYPITYDEDHQFIGAADYRRASHNQPAGF